MKKLAVLLLLTLLTTSVSASVISEEGVVMVDGILILKCRDLLSNFDKDTHDLRENTIEQEWILALAINTFLGTRNVSLWYSYEVYGKNIDRDTDDYKVSRIINDCKKEEYKDGQALVPLEEYFQSLPDLTSEDVPEKFKD